MSATTKQAVVVRLTLDRSWSLYAFPSGMEPTDDRGLRLGLEEIGQIVETGASALVVELEETKAALAKVSAELEPMRDQVATLLRDKALALATAK